MSRRSADADRETYAKRLLRRYPERLAGLSTRELTEAMAAGANGKGGRAVGDGRKHPETDDRYLYVIAFQQRNTHAPGRTLLELLGLEHPTGKDKVTDTNYARILAYYQNHPELYRDVGLGLRWDKTTKRLSVVPLTKDDLAQVPTDAILDAEELLKQKR